MIHAPQGGDDPMMETLPYGDKIQLSEDNPLVFLESTSLP